MEENRVTESPVEASDPQLLELEVYLTEYKALRDELITSLDTQRQIVSLQLAVIGVALSGVAFLQAQPVLLLLGALLLGLLSWIIYEQGIKAQMISAYVEKNLDKDIRKLLKSNRRTLFRWEAYWFSISPRNIILAILASAKYLLGFLLAVVFCVLFVAIKDVWTGEEKALFILDIIVLAIPIILGLLGLFGIIHYPFQKERENRKE